MRNVSYVIGMVNFVIVMDFHGLIGLIVGLEVMIILSRSGLNSRDRQRIMAMNANYAQGVEKYNMAYGLVLRIERDLYSPSGNSKICPRRFYYHVDGRLLTNLGEVVNAIVDGKLDKQIIENQLM